MMDSNLRFVCFCIILFILMVVASCDIESKIKSDLRKISRDIKSQKLCNKDYLGLNKILRMSPLSAGTLPNLQTKIKLYKLDAKLKNPLKKLKAPSLLGLSKLPLIPAIPKLSILPLLPPLPLLPLPLIPPPLLPVPLPPSLLAPKLLQPLPLRLKKLKDKISLQKALGSELKPIWVPAEKKKNRALDKLKKLKIDGSLTNKEYLRFKKLLSL